MLSGFLTTLKYKTISPISGKEKIWFYNRCASNRYHRNISIHLLYDIDGETQYGYIV